MEEIGRIPGSFELLSLDTLSGSFLLSEQIEGDAVGREKFICVGLRA
jgi:hypothetical protein